MGMTPQDYGYMDTFMGNQADRFQTGIDAMRNKFDTSPYETMFGIMQRDMKPQDYGYLTDFLGDTASRFETGIETMKTPYAVDPWKEKFGEITDSMTGPDYTALDAFLHGLETSLGDKRDEINVDPDYGVQEEAILSLLSQIQGPDMSGITEGLGNIWDAAEAAMGRVPAASDPSLSRFYEGVGPDNIICQLDN